MLVPILIGSKVDLPHVQKIVTVLDELGIPSEIRVASAHKVTRYLLGHLEAYEADPRPKVYMTVAGRSNALSGVVDANVSAPVIACPPTSNSFGGADIFSSIRMPSGVAPLLILSPADAALAAAKILSLAEPSLKAKVNALQQAYAEKVLSADRELNPEG